MSTFILTPDERAELDVVADEHRDAWIEATREEQEPTS